MEVAGLVIGVAGLAGLFDVCADALERVDTYRDFGITSRELTLRFDSEKLRLEKWAAAVGIDRDTVKEQHHHGLDEPAIRRVVIGILNTIQDLFATADPLSGKLKPKQLESLNDQSEPDPNKLKRASTWSKSTKLKWSFGREARFTRLVEGLEVLVEKLHVLVPPESAQSTEDWSVGLVLGTLTGESYSSLKVVRNSGHMQIWLLPGC